MMVTDSITRAGCIAAGIGAAMCILGLVLSPDRLGLAWLCAVMFWIGVPFGALALCLTHDLTGGAWGEPLRPVMRAALASLPAPSLRLVLPSGREAVPPRRGHARRGSYPNHQLLPGW